MTPIAKPQLTLNFEPSLPEQWKSLRAYIAFRVQEQRLNAANLAGKMDLSPSMLSRKLTPSEGDTQRFNCDDLENYIKVSGDTSAIEYLASKYLCSDESRKARAIARVEHLATELSNALASIKGAA